MSIKEYKIVASNGAWYEVEAPSRHVARWCGYNLLQHEYPCRFRAFFTLHVKRIKR